MIEVQVGDSVGGFIKAHQNNGPPIWIHVDKTVATWRVCKPREHCENGDTSGFDILIQWNGHREVYEQVENVADAFYAAKKIADDMVTKWSDPIPYQYLKIYEEV